MYTILGLIKYGSSALSNLPYFTNYVIDENESVFLLLLSRK